MQQLRQQSRRRWLCSWPDQEVEPQISIPGASVAVVWAALTNAGGSRSGAVHYLDCRSETEFAAGVVPGSVNVPYPHNGNDEQVSAAEFLEDVEYEEFGRNDEIFVGCRKGPRSAMACEVLINAGYANVTNVNGGIQAWVAAKLPIEPFTG